MRGFFSQFGTVINLRLARNKKTGNSRHYAFIEFSDYGVAEVVARTMNGYMMFGRTLNVELLPQEKIHDSLFVGANRKFRPIPWTRINKERHNRERDAAAQQKRAKRLVGKEKKKKDQLAAMGIAYDFPGYKAELPAQPKHHKFDDS